YNFWRDKKNVRGVWRRTTLAEYRKAAPAWETVLDIDQLAETDNKNWVWHGAECLFPDYRRCLVRLSDGGGAPPCGGGFDVTSKPFVADGFDLPPAKSSVAWRDHDTLFVGTDFGPGSLTSSGYPRIVKSWQRGTPLAQTATIFEGELTDVSVVGYVYQSHEYRRELLRRSTTFFTGQNYLYAGGNAIRLDVPDDATVGSFKDEILVHLRTDWTVGGTTYPADALLAMQWQKFLDGKRAFAVLFRPTPRTTLSSYSATKNHLILNVLDNIRSRIYVLTPHGEKWTQTTL